MTADLVAQARTGDEEAFRLLVEPHRQELTVHCYRILGSIQDAEDVLQETLLAAWQGLSTFEQRSSLRTWLYRIATTRSLNAARSRRQLHRGEVAMGPSGLPEPNGRYEVTWLEPCPEALLEGLQDEHPGPEAHYERAEAVSLAFITALQLLSPLARAVLILRDVLGFHTAEVARMLETTEDSVASALKRARSVLRRERSLQGDAAPKPRSAEERELVELFARAFEAADVRALVALLTDDVRLAMPPLPFEWLGPERASEFLSAVWTSLNGPARLIPTRANGQPAFALYATTPGTVDPHLLGILVLTLTHAGIRALTRFEPPSLHDFQLPATPVDS